MTGLILLFLATLAAGLAAGIVVTLLYLADREEQAQRAIRDFYKQGVQPRHRGMRAR